MATVGHVGVGFAAGRLYVRRGAARWTLAASMVGWSALSMAPDLDVIAFALGVPYHAAWGHRGAVHSLGFAVIVGLCAGIIALFAGWPTLRTGATVTAVLASHGLLDTLTNGGLGIALLWPVSNRRFFAPWRPLPVAPIGRAIFSSWGLGVLLVEALVFAPLFVFALWPR